MTSATKIRSPERSRPCQVSPGLVLRPARPEDRAALVSFLGRCSPDALQQRFLTGVGRTPPAGIVDQLLTPRTTIGRATLALLDGHVVGHGMWASATAEPGCPAELGPLVRDDHQGPGIGSALVDVPYAEIAARGVHLIEVRTAADNRVVTGMIGRRAAGVRPERDGTTLVYRLPAELARAPVTSSATRRLLAPGA